MKKRSKGRQKRPNSRSKSWEDRESRDERRDERFDKRSSNDPAWYASDSSLLRDSASYPFSQPIGAGFKSFDGDAKTEVIPGICVLRLTPTVGVADAPNSPVNIAATSIYSFIRHANSGHSNYDAPDMMLYLLAMSNIYGAINWAQRLYGLTTLYAQRNAYLPRSVILAQGVDPDSMSNNMANYRMALNVIINKVSSLAVPGNMTLFNRIAFLYSNIYSEGSSIKDQLYMYVPNGFYKFGYDDNSAGMLSIVATPDTPMETPLSSQLWKWDDVINYINDLVNAVWAEEDFGIMSGDILRAYGDNIIKLVSLDEFYPIVPLVDEMVLEQMHNAKINNSFDTNLEIKQHSSGAYLVSYLRRDLSTASTQAKSINHAYANGNYILSLNSEAPTPEMVIEATRLMPYCHTDASTFIDFGAGTEVCTEVYYAWANTGGLFRSYRERFSSYTVVQTTGTFTNTAGRMLAMRAAFKYAPVTWLFVLTQDGSEGTLQTVEIIGNVDNYTVLSNHDREKLHTAALLNMLNVPSIAKNAISQR